MTQLIITEKPSQAKKIADALADGKAIKESQNGVPYYKITHQKKDIIVGCAVGHLYTVAEKKKSFTYPSFDVEWVPTADVDKNSAFSRKYLNVLKQLTKQCKEFMVACDYDIEGEVIGLNVVRNVCKQKDASRMKFSTLTKDELLGAYHSAHSSLDWGQANAGLTRHVLDWYYGINLSRALTLAVKAAGSFKLLSSGRVQGPTLKILVEKEREIQAFKPEPYWQLKLESEKDRVKFEAWHEKDKFKKEQNVKKAYDNAKGNNAVVVDNNTRNIKQSPPTPFDLGTLQSEAYRCFGFQPKTTLQLAQSLYVGGFTSYPRTSSQKLPSSLGYRNLLNKLKSQSKYEKLASQLLVQKALRPNEGKKDDPAHPAIYPTGIPPKKIGEREAKVYDLIVKRFMATFGTHATRETMTVRFDVGKEIFVSRGSRTVDKGWHVYYAPYVNLSEDILPKFVKGDSLNVKKLEILKKMTQPPKRYTPASLVSEMEKRGLGTKGTRADIVDALFRRGYAVGQSIEATEIGIKTIEILDKLVPEIIDEKLTKHFEDEMEEIRQGRLKSETVLKEAESTLTGVLKKFKSKEKDIGKDLIAANKETETSLNTIGKCPKCREGTLMIKRSKFGRFIACDKYPDCTATFSLPKTGLIKATGKLCEKCNSPIIDIVRNRRRSHLCINPECESKDQVKTVEDLAIEKPCPKCKGRLVIRKSIYGEFYGCSNYPKCRYSEPLNGKKNNSTGSDSKKK
ncbi:DNA topoisomerase I [Candidatus Woesearchaeota archaeon]|nr:DNA topoisomerase I [Candidatus Woesearchaeota archaeon]